MKFLAAVSAGFLLLFLTVSMPAFSQDDRDRGTQQGDKARDRDKDKDNSRQQPRPDDRGARQDQRRDDSRPAARQENRDNRQQDRDRDNNNGVRQQEERREQRPVEHADRNHDQRRGEGRRVERIPDDRFRASFGREHRFHVDRARVYSQPQPIVIYGGYSFELVEAWPSDWSFDDDCYVDYDGGQYWLYDARRPGMRIAVIVLEQQRY